VREAWERSSFGLLTRLFLRQFLENDAISPEADRSQLLAVVGALAMSLTLFLSFVMSAKYVSTWMPGEAAVTSLDDKFLYLAFGMIVTALVAATQWDALSIDPRDAAILEPLPVEAGIIRRAKLAAVAILGGAVAIAVNLFPSFVFPWLLIFGFRQLSAVMLIPLVAAHALVTVAAAAFGYLAVIAFRETLALILGSRLFGKASPWLQGGLIVVLGSALLLLPAAADGIARRGFNGGRALSPPAWFLGVYETLAGGIIADLPRSRMTPRQAESDRRNSALYDERRQEFPALAQRAVYATASTAMLAAVAYWWRARRLPSLSPAPPPSFRRGWRVGAQLANALVVRDPAARAGFYFALAAMWRNNTHRLTLACAAAGGFAMAVLALSNAFPEEGSAVTVRLLWVQPLLFCALLVGFRHIIRVPAELRANWGFQLAWNDRGEAFLAGVKAAAVVGLVAPALLIVLPLFVYVLGTPRALLHGALGLAGAIVFLELVMHGYDKVPFTCTYLPSENMKALAPVYAIAFALGTAGFARLQHSALHGGSAISLVLLLAVVFVVLRVVTRMRPRQGLVDFDESPVTFSGLNLSS
jgi:hypothetical protein